MTSSSYEGLPQYFVSTAHGTLIRDDRGFSDWRPWGDQHARELGTNVTACGRGAAGWRMFADLPFPSVPTVTCRKCMQAVARARQDMLASVDA